jgi:hypothetical protein
MYLSTLFRTHTARTAAQPRQSRRDRHPRMLAEAVVAKDVAEQVGPPAATATATATNAPAPGFREARGLFLPIAPGQPEKIALPVRDNGNRYRWCSALCKRQVNANHETSGPGWS